jgi:phosphoglucosamine mutase
MAELLAGVALFPQVLVNVRMSNPQQWAQHAPLQAALAQAEAQLNGTGRVLIRASGTEPVLRVMVEAQDAALAHALAEQLAAVAQLPA